MIGKLFAWLTVLALRSKRLSGEDKIRVTTALLDNVRAVPIRSVIRFDTDGRLIVNDKPVSIEHIVPFVEGCQSLRDSVQRKLIRDQILYKANEIGLHDGLTTEMIMFAKAAIWVVQEEDRLIEELASR